MKNSAIALLLFLASLPCLAQIDNTFYAKAFPGSDVGTKVANAQDACNLNAAVPCVIVIDPSLAVWPAGTMPTPCVQCSWMDYRSGAPWSNLQTLRVKDFASMGPRYDVTAYGATGNGITDDTAAIQAAFNACWAAGTGKQPYGGVVEFPGPTGTYVISSTIYAYDSCRIEGVVSGNLPAAIRWNGPAAGMAVPFTSFTAAANTSYFDPSSPNTGVQRAPAQAYSISISASNSLSPGNWVLLQNCSTAQGLELNNLVAPVAAASGSSFTVVTPAMLPSLGTFTDASCTATTITVAIAFDSFARNIQEVKDVELNNFAGIPAAQDMGVGIYFGSRTDTGTRINGAMVQNATVADYYFPAGGINTEFDKGWRSDGPTKVLGNIYWRVSSTSDNLGLANGTISVNSASGSTAQVMLDNQACGVSGTNNIRLTEKNMDHEADSALTAGFGVFTLLDCATSTAPQYFLDFEGVGINAAVSLPSIVMSPPNDVALQLSMVNSHFGSDGALTFSGLPSLSRYDASGSSGYRPLMSYTPSLKSIGFGGAGTAYIAFNQLFGDTNVGQMWQYGVKASMLLYSDTGFAALPNATTLFAGQILAPPAYWNGANGKRYALDVVYQSGTTGTPNGGATTCETTATANQFVCTSATDLSYGQYVSVPPAATRQITGINAMNPSAVIVSVNGSVGTISTPTTLSFVAPVLGPEIQMPTKSSAAPTTLAWSQGDMMQNAAAAANGVAAWVNVSAGSPGTWAGIPLGNSSGQITPAQISGGYSGTKTAGSCVLTILDGIITNVTGC
jgi:hypothetical protein